MKKSLMASRCLRGWQSSSQARVHTLSIEIILEESEFVLQIACRPEQCDRPVDVDEEGAVVLYLTHSGAVFVNSHASIQGAHFGAIGRARIFCSTSASLPA